MADLSALAEHIRAHRELPPPRDRKALRERAGLSQGQVADAVGVTAVSVHQWEQGSTPRPGHLERYVDVLRLCEAES